jgi:hypothetical protein
MTDRPKHRDDEPLDPDAENAEQDDEGEQAQTVAQEALDRATSCSERIARRHAAGSMTSRTSRIWSIT